MGDSSSTLKEPHMAGPGDDEDDDKKEPEQEDDVDPDDYPEENMPDPD